MLLARREYVNTIMELKFRGGSVKGTTDFEGISDECDLPNFEKCEEREEIELEFKVLYKGQWLGNEKHGYGVQIWPDGARYEGLFQNNLAHGNGTLQYKNGDKYEGMWKKDKAHGFGKYTYKNGATYEGQWKYDLKHGQAIEILPDQARFEGEFSRG